MNNKISRHRVKPRVNGVYYHVMTRTAQGFFLLQDDDFREVVYDIIRFYARVYYVEVQAIAVMSNHYHVVLRMDRPDLDKDEVRRRFELMQTRRANKRKWSPVIAAAFHERLGDLSKLMWDINRGISWKHNRAFERKGHLWGCRFKSILIEGQAALLKVMSYVELNSVKAKMVEDPCDYAYASIGKATHPDRGPAGIQLPQIGFLAGLDAKTRWNAYRCWLRRLADILLGKVRATDPFPELRVILGNLDIGDVVTEMRAGTPVNWSQRALGSDSFRTWVARENKKHVHALMLKRIASSKVSQVSSI